MRELEKIKQSQFEELLPTGENICVFGASGIGKSSIVKKYAEDTGKNLTIISLAMEIPETVGGIPYAKTTTGKKTEYFTKLLSDMLEPVLAEEGKDQIIFFDEINQGTPEVYNALYGICHPDPAQRHWNGHSLRYAQIIGAGNKDDGSDGTVYLNSLPVPLLNRFFVAELVSDKLDTKTFLKEKWKNIPHVVKYIDVLLENDIPPRDIDACLKILAYDMNGLLLQMKIGGALTKKLFYIQNKIKTADPAETLKLCRQSYIQFKEDGRVQWASEIIDTEEDLLDKLREILSEEEIQSIVRGEK